MDIEVKKTKKQIIHEAAAQLFRDKGYAATSMRDLAEAVNLKASSLYNHISSKEEILKDICFANAHRFLSIMEEVEATLASPQEKVRQLLSLHIRTAMQDTTSVTAFNDEWRHLSEPELSEFKALRKDYEGRFLAIIKEGITDNTFQDLEPKLVLYTIFSSVRWLYDWFKAGKRLSAEDVEQEMVQFIMGGLLAK